MPVANISYQQIAGNAMKSVIFSHQVTKTTKPTIPIGECPSSTLLG